MQEFFIALLDAVPQWGVLFELGAKTLLHSTFDYVHA
jgi:hypothetical protein